MSGKIEWVEVKRFKKPIGAVGFHANKAIAVIAYYDDQDANKDGSVSWGEWAAFKAFPLNMEGMNIVEVLMMARIDLVHKDASINDWAMKKYLGFAQNLLLDAVYTAYFARGVSVVSGSVAKKITSSAIKEFAVRKGFEAAAKKAFRNATHN